VTDDVRAAAQAWMDDDPDADTRTELTELLAGDPATLAARFAGRLQFGTAGLRGELGAGPLRMNRVIVRRAAAGLARYLLDTVPDAKARGVVIGFDARRKSDLFAEDTAQVMAGAGIRALLLPRPLPTPVLAVSITELGCCAGVMVTASHNPPKDNGYKVYLGEGAQIAPPADTDISARIDAVTSLADVPVAASDDPLIERLGDEVLERYLAHVAGVRLVPDAGDVGVAYTPLHGVGGEVVLKAFTAAGFSPPSIVTEQFDPDPSFPTVSFPNPEEPGAMDLLLALAETSGADIAIANDPDADRLGCAIPTAGETWRPLRGDEIGWLLADHILGHTSGDDRLVITTVVSSTLLGRMAEAAGVHYAETYTGFKWIAQAVLQRPEQRFVFGYEQALGYLVTRPPLDKDGITAAVLMAEVAAVAKADGVTLEDRLADIEARFGRHVTAERSVPMSPAAMPGLMDALRAEPPAELGGAAVTGVEDFPDANLLRYHLDGGARVQVRPSGTEPKVKLYGEAVDADPGPALDALTALLGTYQRPN
jgi:phosphomannomutase